MSSLSGADPDALEIQAQRMVTAAEQFDTIRNEVTTLLSRLYWEGGHADEFRHYWDTVLADRLSQVEQWLRGSGFILRINAAQQRQASEGFAGLAGGGDNGITLNQLLDRRLKRADIAQFPFTFPKDLEDLKFPKALEDLKFPKEVKGLASQAAEALRAGTRSVAQAVAGATTPEELEAVGKDMENFAANLDKWHVGKGIIGVDLLFNFGSLAMSKPPATASERDEKADHQVNATLDALSLIPGPQEPVLIAATVGYEAVSLVDPHIGTQVEDGVRAAATSVVHSAVFVAEAHVHVAEAAGRIISRGVGSVLGGIHL